jgi:hypothetical protein
MINAEYNLLLRIKVKTLNKPLLDGIKMTSIFENHLQGNAAKGALARSLLLKKQTFEL